MQTGLESIPGNEIDKRVKYTIENMSDEMFFIGKIKSIFVVKQE